MLNNIDYEVLCKKMKASYDSQATEEEAEKILQKYGKGSNAKPAKPEFNRHMFEALDQQRCTDTSYCSCKNCSVLPYDSIVRENFCCRDAYMSKNTKLNKNIREVFAGNPQIQCITDWARYKKLCLDKEVLLSHLQYSQRLKKTRIWKEKEVDNKNLRYIACSVYTTLIHGETLGYCVRLEMPNCVRNSIIAAFPEASGAYSTFEAVPGEDHTLADNEYHMPGFCEKCTKQKDQVHRFPENYARALEWAKNMAWEREFISITERKKCESITICSEHFSDDCYTKSDRKRLIYGAMPTKCEELYLEKRRIETVISTATIELNPSHHDLDTTCAEPVKKKVLLSSQDSDRTFVSSSLSQGTTSDVFFEQERPHERRIRRDNERKSMEETSKIYSLLSHSSFLELLDYIPGCLKCKNINAPRTFKKIGVVLEMTTDCPKCNRWAWTSTPRAHTDSQGSMMEGNIDMSTCMFTSGVPYERCADMLTNVGLGCPRRQGHYELIKNHIKPVVNKVHEEDTQDVKERLQTLCAANGASKLSCIGDAQFDTRGFSAEVCRYTLMEYQTRFVVDYEVLLKRENQGNSPVMESRAFATVMNRWANNTDLNIGQVTTDKNSAVIAHIKKAHPSVAHRLDKWHVLKNFKKNNIHAVQLVRNCDLKIHWAHLLVHIWISIEVANGNGELAVELIRSAEYHLQGVHTLPKDKFKILTQCMHGPLPAGRSYLDPQKHVLQIKVLHDMLNSPVFLENVRRCAPIETTSPLESFHSLVALIYIPKNHYYDKDTTKTLMQLAILHHNSHRRQILDSIASGAILPVQMKYSKAQGRTRPVVQHPKPSMHWKVTIKERVMRHYVESKNEQETNRTLGRPVGDDDAEEMADGSNGDADEEVDVGEEDAGEEDAGEEDAGEEDIDSDDTEGLGDTSPEEEDESIDERASPTSTSTDVYVTTAPKPRIGPLGPRSFAKVYRELGVDADKYDYFDRHGSIIVPIPNINDM